MQLIPSTGKVWACEEPFGPQEHGGTTAGIDPCLRNGRLLYYIIIDVAGKCHRQSVACCLLCCIVSLVCIGPLCFASSVSHCMFIYTVCLLAFIFLLQIQLGGTGSSFHLGEGGVGWEGNEFLQTLLEALR